MAFRQEEFKKTTRKGGDDAPGLVYPHQIKDKKVTARLEIAIRLFDTSVGKRRRDMDAQAMTDFFGDPRLARGVVACLRQFYKYETPDFARAVGREAAGRLSGQGLARPSDVRAWTYAHVNAHHGGFLGEAERPICYDELGEAFGLSAHQWDTLLHLDAEDNQVLTRTGAVPAPADIVALYNFHSLDTALKRATKITLAGMPLSPTDAADVRALARALDVKAAISTDGVLLTPTEGSRPGRLSRALLLLLQAHGSRAASANAEVKIGGRSFRLLLASESLRTLGMPVRPSGEGSSLRRRTEGADRLHKDLLKLRARGEAAGWRIKRLPEPTVTANGVLLPDFTLTHSGRAAHVVLSPAPAGEWNAPVLALPPGRKAPDAADVLARALALSDSLFTLPALPVSAVPGDVLALCDRAANEGMVRVGEARRVLHLLDESPLIEWVRQAADPRVRYIPGIGLCSRALVEAIQKDETLPLAV